MFLTLEYNGTEKTLAAWGFDLEGARCVHLSLRQSTYRLSLPGGALSDDPIFPFEAKVIIRRGRLSDDGSDNSFTDGTVAFIGYRQNTLIDGRPDWSGVHYEFANAWNFLERCTYQQSTASWTGTGTPVKAYPLTSDVTLCERTTTDGGGATVTQINNGDQIRDCLQFLLDHPPSADATPFEIGPIDPDLPIGTFPISEITCADAIRKVLELSPDVTTHWDYNTIPPTIYFRSRSNREPLTLALANGTDHKSIRITPRYDLVPDAVIVFWRIVYANGLSNTLISYVKEKWGPHGANSTSDPDAGPDVVLQTFNLIGSTFSRDRAYLRTRVCNANTGTTADTDRIAWWALHHLEFANEDRIDALTISNATFTDEVTGEVFTSPPLPNELLDTQIASWMSTADFGLSQRTLRIDATANYHVHDTPVAGGASFAHAIIHDQPISTRIVLTDGESGWYQLLAATVGDEADAGSGIARKIFESLALQYEGSHIRVESQITAQISLANALCLSGGKAAWETMEATIQSIEEDDGRGETVITFGPPRQLSAADLRAIQYFNRTRQSDGNDHQARGTGIA